MNRSILHHVAKIEVVGTDEIFNTYLDFCKVVASDPKLELKIEDLAKAQENLVRSIRKDLMGEK